MHCIRESSKARKSSTISMTEHKHMMLKTLRMTPYERPQPHMSLIDIKDTNLCRSELYFFVVK